MIQCIRPFFGVRDGNSVAAHSLTFNDDEPRETGHQRRTAPDAHAAHRCQARLHVQKAKARHQGRAFFLISSSNARTSRTRTVSISTVKPGASMIASVAAFHFHRMLAQPRARSAVEHGGATKRPTIVAAALGRAGWLPGRSIRRREIVSSMGVTNTQPTRLPIGVRLCVGRLFLLWHDPLTVSRGK
jgi:hypothetical protein